PVRRAADVDGHLRLRVGEGIPEGRGDGRSRVADGGQEPATSPRHRDGALTVSAPRPEQTVLVVDFGAQYAQLIARRVREAHVYSEIVPPTMPVADMLARRPAGIILSGGPKSVHVEGAPAVDAGLFATGVPVLGICYGAQLVAQQLGGEVARTGRGEYGRTALQAGGALDSPLFGK